jgi:urea transporter
MPKTQEYLFQHGFVKRKPFQFILLCIDIVLRGIAQVFLCNHPICGIFVCIGLLMSDYQLPLYALIGTAVSTASAVLVARPPQADVLAGLCGYDGALVGCSCYVFLLEQQALGAAFLLSILAGIVHVAMTNLMKMWELPSFTFAFNIVMIMMLFSIKGDAVALHFSDASPAAHQEEFTEMSLMFAVDASIRGVGQFMFASTTVGSGFVLAGITMCSRKGASIALLGSIVGWLVSYYILHVRNVVNVRSGIYGYNCAGTCCALAGGIFYKVNDGAVLVGVFGACLAALLTVGFQGIFDGLPVLTFPFITSTWIIMLSRSKWLHASSDGILKPMMRRLSSSRQFSSKRVFKIPLLDYYPTLGNDKKDNKELFGRGNSNNSAILSKNSSAAGGGGSFFGGSRSKLSRVFSSNNPDTESLEAIEEESHSQGKPSSKKKSFKTSLSSSSKKLRLKPIPSASVDQKRDDNDDDSSDSNDDNDSESGRGRGLQAGNSRVYHFAPPNDDDTAIEEV